MSISITLLFIYFLTLHSLATARGRTGLAWRRAGQVERPMLVSRAVFEDGVSVALSGNLAIVGAHSATLDAEVATGVALLMKKGTDGTSWSVIRQLSPRTNTERDYFGYAVALSDVSAAIGAPRSRGGEGSVYMYDRLADDIYMSDHQYIHATSSTVRSFGSALSLAPSGDRVVIGAPLSTYVSAYVYFRQPNGTWERESLLRAPEGVNDYARFGWAVAISGDSALVAADNDDGVPDDYDYSFGSVGSVYHYSYDDLTGHWILSQKLVPSDAQENWLFGYSLAMFGDRAIIGALQDFEETGSAYIFRLDGDQWVEETKLTAYDGGRAGHSVALHDQVAVIGSHYDGDAANQVVSVYEREEGTWRLVKSLDAGDSGGLFGQAVACDNDTILVRSPGGGFVQSYYRWQEPALAPTTTTTATVPPVTTAPERVKASNFTTAAAVMGDGGVQSGDAASVAVGAGVAALVVIALLVLLLFCVVRRRRRTRRSVADKARAATPERRHKLKCRSASRAHGMSRSSASSRRQSKNYGKLPVMQPAGEHYQLGSLTLVDEHPYSNMPGAEAKSSTYEHGDMLLQGNVSDTYKRGEAMLSAQLAGAGTAEEGQYQRGPIPSPEEYGTVGDNGAVDGGNGYERGELLLNSDARRPASDGGISTQN